MLRKVLLLAVIVISIQVNATNPIKDLIKKSGDVTKFPTSNLLLIFDSTNVDVQESGLSFVNTHTLYKVLTPKGALSISVIKYDYEPLSAYVEIKKVLIHRNDGSTEELDTKKVMDYPAPARAIYWGASEKMIEVGRLEPGDAVEVFLFKKGYTYALLQDESGDDDKYIPPMKGHFYDIVQFWSDNPILTKVYQVKIPKTKALQYKFYNGEVESFTKEEGGKNLYSFTVKNIMPIEKEDYMVAFSDIAPKLLMSTSPDWKAKSLWFYGVNEDYGSFKSTPEIKAKVDEVLEGAKDEMDSISKLTHWVADEIRYSGITMGKGEGYTLHTGEMTFRDRCGVCKDKAGMLITMLRAAGFESYPAMTMAGSRIEYIPADQFNHCVSLVKLSNGKYQLLDPTWVPWVRELWSSAEQQQNYLKGIPEGADLDTTPISSPENHYFKIIGNSELLIDGTLKGEFTLTAEGQSDASVRRIFVRDEKVKWDANLEKELLKISPLAKITEMNYGDPYDYTNPITITIKYIIPQYAIVTNEEIIFTPLVASNLFKNNNPHLLHKTDINIRKYNFRDACSKLITLNETIKLPAYKEVTYIPKVDASDGSGASYEGGYKIEGQMLNLSEKVVLEKRIYETADWDSYKKAVVSQNKLAEEPIILKLK